MPDERFLVSEVGFGQPITMSPGHAGCTVRVGGSSPPADQPLVLRASHSAGAAEHVLLPRERVRAGDQKTASTEINFLPETEQMNASEE